MPKYYLKGVESSQVKQSRMLSHKANETQRTTLQMSHYQIMRNYGTNEAKGPGYWPADG